MLDHRLRHPWPLPTLGDLADGSFGNSLDKAKERNGGLYAGAFILCATDAYGQSAKHRNHVELFRHMFLHGHLAARLLEAKTLREVHGLLHGYPLMGTSPARAAASRSAASGLSSVWAVLTRSG